MNTKIQKAWRWAGMFLLLAAVMGALQWNWFAMPLERDEGEYAYSAWLMRTGRGVPYHDSFLQKPPMIIYTYALVEVLAPKSDKVGFRVAGFLAALATAGLVWRLGTREFGGRAGLWAAWLWVAFLQQWVMFNSIAANVEKFMVVPMLGAMLAAGAGEKRWWRWGLAGVLGTTAVLYKPICLPVLGVYFLVAGVLKRGGKFGRFFQLGMGETSVVTVESSPPRHKAGNSPWGGTQRGRDGHVARVLVLFGWLALGGALALAAGVAWFVWNGSLEEMWECTVKFTGEYAKLSGNPWQIAAVWWRLFGTWKLWLLLGMAAAGTAFRWRDGWRWTAVFAVSAVVSMSGINAHYFLMTLPFSAMLAGAGVDRMSALGGNREAWTGAFLTAVLVVALTGSGLERQMLKAGPERLCKARYGGNPFIEAEEAGKLLAQTCEEDGTVHVVGSEPEILWYARRKGATRFDIAYPMTLPTALAEKYQEEALATLAREPPEALVVAPTLLGVGFGPMDVYAKYMRAMVAMVAGGRYQLAWAFVPDKGWGRGGDWAEREKAGASLGIWRKHEVERKADMRSGETWETDANPLAGRGHGFDNSGFSGRQTMSLPDNGETDRARTR